MTGPGEPVYPAISSCPTTSPVGLAPGYRVAIYDETDTHAPVLLGVAQPVANLRGVYSFTFPNALNDGSHFILAKVQLIDPGNDSRNRAAAKRHRFQNPRCLPLRFTALFCHRSLVKVWKVRSCSVLIEACQAIAIPHQR